MSKQSRARAAASAKASSAARAAAKAAGGAMSSPLQEPGAFLARRGVLLAGSVLVLAVLAAYSNCLSSPFIFDDQLAISDNPTIRHLWSAWSLPHYVSAVTSRPLINFSLAVNYAWGGFDVRGYHALNLAIHIFATLALFGIVRRTFRQPTLRDRFAEAALPLAFTVALLWAVHPLQTESVTFVVQRTESLMGLFYLLTLYFFIRGVERRSGFTPDVSGINPELQLMRGKLSHNNAQKQTGSYPPSSRLSSLSSGLWFAASVLSCLLGMASKEVMVSAPLIVLLYDRTFVAGTFREAWGKRWRFYAGLACTWLLLAYLVAAAGGSRGTAAGFGLGITPWTYALTQCQAIILYLKLSVWPHPLILDYGVKVVGHLAEVLPQALTLVLLFLATILGVWRRPALGFVGAWFFAILAPSSSVVPLVLQTVAEHRMYLPLASVVVLVVLGLHALLGPRAWYAGVGLAVLATVLTLRRNEDYQSPLSMWAATVAGQPDNARARYNLGNMLLELPGRMPEAMVQFEAAVRLNPRDEQAHYNYGNALHSAGRIPEAIAQYEEALRLKPDYIEAHNNLGSALIISIPSRLPEAIGHFEAALQIEPDYADAHYNFGIALSNSGRIPEAIVQYKEAVRLNPGYADAHYNLGVALANTGQIPEAIAQYKEALRIKPDFTAARTALEQFPPAAR